MFLTETMHGIRIVKMLKAKAPRLAMLALPQAYEFYLKDLKFWNNTVIPIILRDVERNEYKDNTKRIMVITARAPEALGRELNELNRELVEEVTPNKVISDIPKALEVFEEEILNDFKELADDIVNSDMDTQMKLDVAVKYLSSYLNVSLKTSQVILNLIDVAVLAEPENRSLYNYKVRLIAILNEMESIHHTALKRISNKHESAPLMFY